MGYYIATISVSLFAESSEELTGKIKTALNAIRENKDLSPYVDQVKNITNDPDKRVIQKDSNYLKKINQK